MVDVVLAGGWTFVDGSEAGRSGLFASMILGLVGAALSAILLPSLVHVDINQQNVC